MMRSILLALILCGIESVALAQTSKWVLIGTYGSSREEAYRAYIDINSIEASGNRRSFAYKEFYLSGQKNFSDKYFYTRKYSTAIVNCWDGTFSNLFWVYADWNDRQVDSDGYFQPQMRQTIPGRYTDDLLRFVCDR